MWLFIGIALPIIWLVTLTFADIFRGHLNNDWYAYWLYMFTLCMPWMALAAGALHIFFQW